MDVNRIVVKLTGPLRRRIANAIGRAVIRLVDDAAHTQLLQLTALADETHDRVERYQEYGFTSRPHPGAHAVLVALGGNRAPRSSSVSKIHAIACSSSRPARLRSTPTRTSSRAAMR